MYARTTRTRKFHFRLHWSYWYLKRRTRYERWSHSVHEGSHSRINNVRRRTKIFTGRRFSRARRHKRTRQTSWLSGKIGKIARHWCPQPEYPLVSQNTEWPVSPWSLSLPTTPTSACNGSRYNRVFIHYAESQKPLSLITLLSFSLSHPSSALPFVLFFFAISSCTLARMLVRYETRQRARRENKRDRKRGRRVGLA